MASTELETEIIHAEDIRKSVYKDSLGYFTIGIGFLCDEKLGAGLSIDECMFILRSRIQNLERELGPYSWFQKSDRPRQEALIHLAYNLGIPRLLNFKNMLSCFDKKDYVNAVKELLNSRWATQVQKSRVDGLTYLIKEGKYAARKG